MSEVRGEHIKEVAREMAFRKQLRQLTESREKRIAHKNNSNKQNLVRGAKKNVLQ